LKVSPIYDAYNNQISSGQNTENAVTAGFLPNSDGIPDSSPVTNLNYTQALILLLCSYSISGIGKRIEISSKNFPVVSQCKPYLFGTAAEATFLFPYELALSCSID